MPVLSEDTKVKSVLVITVEVVSSFEVISSFEAFFWQATNSRSMATASVVKGLNFICDNFVV